MSRTSDVTTHGGQLRITVGRHPAPVLAPFADVLREHLSNRPNLLNQPPLRLARPGQLPAPAIDGGG